MMANKAPLRAYEDPLRPKKGEFLWGQVIVFVAIMIVSLGTAKRSLGKDSKGGPLRRR